MNAFHSLAAAKVMLADTDFHTFPRSILESTHMYTHQTVCRSLAANLNTTQALIDSTQSENKRCKTGKINGGSLPPQTEYCRQAVTCSRHVKKCPAVARKCQHSSHSTTSAKLHSHDCSGCLLLITPGLVRAAALCPGHTQAAISVQLGMHTAPGGLKYNLAQRVTVGSGCPGCALPDQDT